MIHKSHSWYFLIFLLAPHAHAMKNLLTITEGSYTVPSKSQAVVTLENTADFDVTCNMQVVGIISGSDAQSGKELKGRKGSESVIGFTLKAKRTQERIFDFAAAVDFLRKVWNDPQATLVEVDQQSLVSECEKVGTVGPADPTDPSGGVVYATCEYPSSDPDGDGWGYENGHSCKMDVILTPGENPPEAGYWYSEYSQTWHYKFGVCEQYSNGFAEDCLTNLDNLNCAWNPSTRTCAYRGSRP